jgi:beta-galactosidase/beta-glucuronidase
MSNMAGEIQIVASEVNDIEARVHARYLGGAEGVAIVGTIRGPYCEKARTLPAEFSFREVKGSDRATSEAVIPDPSTWTPDVPHLYRVSVEARRGEEVVAKYDGEIGLRGSERNLND